MSVSPLPLSASLPWSAEGNEYKKFWTIFFVVFMLMLVLGVIVPNIDLPERTREEIEKLPPQLAKLVRTKAEKPKPVTPAPVVIPKEKPEPVVQTPEPSPKPVPKLKPAAKPQSKITSDTQKIEKAKEVAKSSGLMALQSQMSEMVASVDRSSFSRKNSAESAQAAATKATSVETISARDASKGSGKALSHKVSASAQDIALSTQQATTLNETSGEKALALAQANARSDLRDPVSVSRVIESLKSSFNTLYNRALRNDPFLEGELILEVTIAPSGQITAVVVVDSTLENSALIKKIIARLKLADFGSQPVKEMVRRVPLSFEPS